MTENDVKDPLLQQTASVNPYRFGVYELANRLRWDINPESWRSRRILRRWRDRFISEKAIILCNGPSLLEVDLSLLNDVVTFGLNKINLLFDKTGFRPSCIASVNAHVIEQNAKFFNETDIPLFLDSGARRHIQARQNVAFLHSTTHHKVARDCGISIYPGHTVTFVALQLALHMGIREVALVGCDHNFATKGPANKAVVSGSHDPNHFDPDYFAGGATWQLPDLVQSEINYMMAGQMFEALGGRIVNCTEGGKLKIFPCWSLQEFLAAPPTNAGG